MVCGTGHGNGTDELSEWARTQSIREINQGDLACGPFVEVTSAYNSLNAELRSISVVGYVSCRPPQSLHCLRVCHSRALACGV